MPASRKPPRKGPATPSSKSASAAVKLPDRRAMESFMSAIGAPRAKSARDKAQDVMYQAWDQAEPSKRIALANKALTISPLCADAYVLQADCIDHAARRFAHTGSGVSDHGLHGKALYDDAA